MVFDEIKDGVILRVRLSPNSSSCGINGFFALDGIAFLKINVISVPEKGKANKELIGFLSKALKMPKKNIEIVSGELDRFKKLSIKGVDTKKLVDVIGDFI
jgi:uncharacterized protein (TIGR00251 family)